MPRRTTSPSPPSARDGKRVILIGSSGGSTNRSTAVEEFENISSQLAQLPNVSLDGVCFVEASFPLDQSATTPVNLWSSKSNETPKICARDSLGTVNCLAEDLNKKLAQRVRKGEIDAIISTSADFVGKVNNAVLDAAVATGTPMLGTGGTSLGIAVEAGATLLQLSGSVSTTAESRAIAAAAALARHWKLPYTPKLPTPETDPLPILDAILPLALTFSILTALSTKLTYLLSTAATAPQPSPWWRPSAAPLPSLPTVTLASRLADASRIGLPIALSAVAARRTAQLGDSGLLAGVLAGALTVAYDGAGIAALIGGMCAGLSCRRVLGATHAVGLPATASTLLTVGGSGVAGGLLGSLLVYPTSVAASLLRSLLHAPASLPLALRGLLGALLGVLTKWGSINGYYHSVHFPLILLEMEGGHLSLLGAYDACCLCGVCAGVMAAVAITSKAKAEASAAKSAFKINFFLGDYVEACYPYMERSAKVNAAAYLGAALSGAVLLASSTGEAVTRSSAYLPLPLAVAISDGVAAMALAVSLAVGVPCVLSFL